MERKMPETEIWDDDEGGKQLSIEKVSVGNRRIINLAWLILILVSIIILYSMTLYAFFPSERTENIWNYVKFVVFPATFVSIVATYFKSNLKLKS